MKKLFGLMLGFCLVSSVAMANQVIWYQPYGMYTHDATDLVTEDSGAVLDSFDVLWQLIWAGPEGVADPIDVTNSANGYVSGNDFVLDYRNLSLGNSGIFDHYLYTGAAAQANTELNDTERPYAQYSADDPYFIYQRIYESQTPTDGTYYFQSEVVKIDASYSGSGFSFPVNENGDSGMQANLVVKGADPSTVPEPATMSLLGLGALAMVLRRKLRK